MALYINSFKLILLSLRIQINRVSSLQFRKTLFNESDDPASSKVLETDR
jgi:hypothetical protein